MRGIISLLLFSVFLSGPGIVRVYSQPNSLYYLKGVPQTKDLNPARPGIEKGFYIGLPLFTKIDLSANTNNWSYNDLIHKGTGSRADSLVYDFDKYIASLDNNNFLNESAALTLIEFGWKKEINFFSFSWSEKEVSEAFFTRNLANLIYYGNVPYLGSTYHSGYFGGAGQHYREFAFTFAREMNRKLNIGITGKLLFGLAGAKTSGVNLVAGMPATGDQVDLTASGKVFLSAPVDVLITNNGTYKMYFQNNFDTKSYFTNFGNPGFAVDLGFSTKVSRSVELSASLIDLGFISWKKDLTTFSENGHFLYRGIYLNTTTPTNIPPTATDIRSLIIPLRDSIRAAFLPDQTPINFSTLLPVKLYLAGEYSVNDAISLGGVARIRMYNNLLHTSFTASANVAVTRRLSLSGSYSLMESTYNNIGVAAAYRFGIFQLYAAADNVPSFFYPSTATNSNLRVGINLLFPDDDKSPKGANKKRASRSPIGCPL